MYTIYGAYCPVPSEGDLVARNGDGGLSAVPRSFPGSFDPGPLYATEGEALAAWRAAVEKMFAKTAPGEYVSEQQLTAASDHARSVCSRDFHYLCHARAWQFASRYSLFAAAVGDVACPT